MKKILKGEFVSYEVRNVKNEIIGIDVFYSGVLHHSWRNDNILQIAADMDSNVKLALGDDFTPVINISHCVSSVKEGDKMLAQFLNGIDVDHSKGSQVYAINVDYKGCTVYNEPGKPAHNNYTIRP